MIKIVGTPTKPLLDLIEGQGIKYQALDLPLNLLPSDLVILVDKTHLIWTKKLQSKNRFRLVVLQDPEHIDPAAFHRFMRFFYFPEAI